MLRAPRELLHKSWYDRRLTFCMHFFSKNCHALSNRIQFYVGDWSAFLRLVLKEIPFRNCIKLNYPLLLKCDVEILGFESYSVKILSHILASDINTAKQGENTMS